MIEVQQLTKRYGDTAAVNDLSFTVQPGRVTGFLGPNGAGKSTTMRMILGLDTPTSGEVLVNGRPYRGITSPMREIGALLDPKAFHPKRTAYDHLRWIARAGGLPRTRVDEVLDIVGLADVANRKAGEFSLGMAQRLGIATALLGDPPILLLDEPVNGLDPEGIRWIRSLLQRLAREGRTVFLSSHLMSEMEETAEHIVVIGRGQLIADANIEDFTRNSTSSHVRVVSPRSSDLVPLLRQAGAAVVEAQEALTVTGVESGWIGRIAAEHGIELHELTPRRASLEAAFMELTGDSVEYRATAASTLETMEVR
ncbi:MAG: ABC transporter ATP-binding protein [Dehalococcoidia bacterium]|nr:ABC transporter ATP-binding protein [Dehalococcoidia bacterium]MCB9491904.1 ABC transporter ATP-binding protein [Dehalococcoidia bacterium]